MSFVVINPGSGPVARASARSAIPNMRQWCREAGAGFTFTRKPKWDGDGRFGFEVEHWRPNLRKRGAVVGCKHDILMPGLPLARVRYVRAEGQNIWDFPRLYVDGNSWVWIYSFPGCTEDSPPSSNATKGTK